MFNSGSINVRGVEKQKRNPDRMLAGFMAADPNAQLKPFD